MATISVSIRRDEEGHPVITTSNNAAGVPYLLPSVDMVEAQLTPVEVRASKAARRRHYVRSSLHSLVECAPAITYDRWAQAIAAAIIRTEREQTEGATATSVNSNEQLRAAVEQGDLLDKNSPVLLAGGCLYNVQFVKKVSARATALSVMRTQLRRAAAEELNQLRSAAQSEADVLIEQAQEKLTEAEAIKARAQADRGLIPPFPGIWHSSINGLAAGLPTTFGIHEFRTGQYLITRGGSQVRGCFSWVLPEPVLTQPLLVWVPIAADGSYDKSQIHLANSHGGMLPHMTTSSSCVIPQGIPARIRDGRALDRLISAIVRAFKVVNMGSLLSTSYNWQPEIKAALPLECHRLCELGDLEPSDVTTGTFIPLSQEQEVWSTTTA